MFGKHAMVSTQHPAVTDAAVAVLREGGTAIDALIAACLVQATVAQELTNHAGTVTVLHYQRATGRFQQLNSPGRVVPGLAPFRPLPVVPGTYSAQQPGAGAVVPGFMPALARCYADHARLPWARLVAPALEAATEGHRISPFEYQVMAWMLPYFQWTQSGRAHFTPSGRQPQVGEVWRQPVLADTLQQLANEGPGHFISGGWARAFVERGNELGWPVRLQHLGASPPEWEDPIRFPHGPDEIVSLAAPQIQGVSLALVLGMLRELDVTSIGHYDEEPLARYFLAHVLRRVRTEVGYLNDPKVFDDPTEVMLDPGFQAGLASVIRRSVPHRDLSEHVHLTSRTPSAPVPLGTDSCEISIIDPDGNWVQAMTTLSGSGIPGEVVGGVPMTGSLTDTSLDPPQNISGWYTGGGRVRTVMGNTMVVRNGEPWLALGTPGKVEATVPQVLSNVLDFAMSPDAAEATALSMPLQADYSLPMEMSVAPGMEAGLARLGIRVTPLGLTNWHLGSFQMCWRIGDSVLAGAAGSRREGKAAGF
ncbi:gamma-glutamyltransferase [Nakamurella lactea]|uniref:gamma-glutamyltransferase n=1 Tax=Nakamurella lactea TaxID=459515 RepID=UPI00041A78FA|nr:gamma-glutamyltransferase [Nakamurella lactea]